MSEPQSRTQIPDREEREIDRARRRARALARERQRRLRDVSPDLIDYIRFFRQVGRKSLDVASSLERIAVSSQRDERMLFELLSKIDTFLTELGKSRPSEWTESLLKHFDADSELPPADMPTVKAD